MNTLAVVVAVGARTSVALTARHTAFLLRAGHAGFHEAPLLDANEEPVTFGSVPTLDPLLVGADRIRTLAAPAMAEALEGMADVAATARVHVVLGVPEHLGRRTADGGSAADVLAADLVAGLSKRVGSATSEVIPRGEASTGIRLQAACERLAKNESDVVLLGGCHSDYDLEVIQRLSSLDRLFGAGNVSGIIPGELSAFVALTTPNFARQRGLPAWARLHSVGTGFEKAGPDNDEPAFVAAGLTQALKTAAAPMEAEKLRAGWMLTDLTPETHRVHEWHCAYVRTQKFICDPQWIDSPAHRLGRLGAAALPLHLALAVTAWRHRFAPHPLALSTLASDSGERVATLWSDAGGA